MKRYRAASGRKHLTGSVIAAICLTLFLFTLCVTLVLHFRWLYYLDISLLGLEKASGMTAADIRANYDALIRYNQFWVREALAFPTLPMSREGAIHFMEVKRIFDLIQITCLVSGVLSVILCFRLRRFGVNGHFRAAGIISLVLPAVAGALVALDWERFFVTFHRIVFRNDYWLFDPATDPVIEILPDAYFLQCAAAIVILLLAGCALFLYLGRKRRR